MRISRRTWTALLAASPLAAQAISQPPPQAEPVPAPANATPAEKAQHAINEVQQLSQRLQQIEVPVDVQPAFAFRP